MREDDEVIEVRARRRIWTLVIVVARFQLELSMIHPLLPFPIGSFFSSVPHHSGPIYFPRLSLVLSFKLCCTYADIRLARVDYNFHRIYDLNAWFFLCYVKFDF